MSKTLIFTATYNESENIKKLVETIFRINEEIDLFVIDDNSPDKTFEILEKISKKNDKWILALFSFKSIFYLL